MLRRKEELKIWNASRKKALQEVMALLFNTKNDCNVGDFQNELEDYIDRQLEEIEVNGEA